MILMQWPYISVDDGLDEGAEFILELRGALLELNTLALVMSKLVLFVLLLNI